MAFLVSAHSDKTQERFLHIVIPLCFGIVGFIISMTTSSFGPRYFSFFLQAQSYSGFVCFLAWVSSTCVRSFSSPSRFALTSFRSQVRPPGHDALHCHCRCQCPVPAGQCDRCLCLPDVSACPPLPLLGCQKLTSRACIGLGPPRTPSLTPFASVRPLFVLATACAVVTDAVWTARSHLRLLHLALHGPPLQPRAAQPQARRTRRGRGQRQGARGTRPPRLPCRLPLRPLEESQIWVPSIVPPPLLPSPPLSPIACVSIECVVTST